MRSGAFKAAFIYSLLLPITSSPCCCCYCCCCCCVAFLVLPPLRLGFQWRINEREKHWLSNRKSDRTSGRKIEMFLSNQSSRQPILKARGGDQSASGSRVTSPPTHKPLNQTRSTTAAKIDQLSINCQIFNDIFSLSLSPSLLFYFCTIIFFSFQTGHNATMKPASAN